MRPILVCALLAFVANLPAAEKFVTVKSLNALRPYLSQDGVKVRLAPGTYRLDSATSANFLEISGNNSHFDFNGVKLEVDTALIQKAKEESNMVFIKGNRVFLEGLSIETVGAKYGRHGCRAVSIVSDHVTISNVSMKLEGSYPYGYGSFFGIGADQSTLISPKKLSGIRVGGLNDQVIGCRVIMRCFGHAIFLRGAQHALIKDCYIEGALRKTDDILAEQSGPAFDFKFMQYTGKLIPAGEMTSLSEDGIRAYPDDPTINRRTQNIRVENCRVTRMRRAICLAFAAGQNAITGCEVTESERVGYHISSNTTVRDSRGDALYAQVLDISSSDARNADVHLEVLDSRKHYGNDLLAKINGTGHRVVLKESVAGAVPGDMTVELGSDRGFGEGRMKGPRAKKVQLENRTPASVLLQKPTEGCTVNSVGPVDDKGEANSVKRIGMEKP
ncbi:MAG TPA: right-handed parallel beta-helix repeat-containing protein [Verrucomicrobiae bacterium]|nr:right-handed parallel beta-helix repeat-containing protein [Verrucomicrobiae bacterium]